MANLPQPLSNDILDAMAAAARQKGGPLTDDERKAILNRFGVNTERVAFHPSEDPWPNGRWSGPDTSLPSKRIAEMNASPEAWNAMHAIAAERETDR